MAVEVETGAKTLLTHGDGVRLWPQWLPDGGVGFLMIYPGGEAHVRLLHGDRATDGPRGQLRNPSWSSDGRQVVYEKVARATTLTMLSEFSRQSDFALTRLHAGLFSAFSPNGDRLALGGLHKNPNDVGLELMRPDGTERRPLLYRDGFALRT